MSAFAPALVARARPLRASIAARAAAAALLAALFGTAAAQEAPQLDLPRVELTAGMHRIDAQVAATPQERQTGLMFRKEMPAHEGMLFVFEQPAAQAHQRREHGGLDALGGAAGEQQLSGRDAQHAAGAGAGVVQQGAGPQPGGVGAAGVAEPFAHAGQRRGLGGRQHRGGGVRVEVDLHGLEILVSPAREKLLF